MAHAVEPPIAPMLARLSRELPEGDVVYEPKWDGFRCLAFARRAPRPLAAGSRRGLLHPRSARPGGARRRRRARAR